MDELNAARKQAQRFGQLFQLIGTGFSEYIALIEQQRDCRAPQSPQQLEEELDERPRNGNGEEAEHEDGINSKPCSSSTLPFPLLEKLSIDDNQNQTTNMARWPTAELENGDRLLMTENHRLYKLHVERLAKLQRDYAKWRMKLEKDSFRLFPSANPLLHSSSTNLTSTRSIFSRFAPPPLLFCRRPSPQRQNRLYRPQSINSLSKSKGEGKFDRTKSQSDLDLSITSKSEAEKEEGREAKKESFRAIRAAMTAIEAEMCGMLGRLEFQVQGIVGFARLCSGDVFEVSIKHGHQKWRTRGKTQPDKSQRWDQQPASTSMNILWNVPVHIKACELGFLRSRCLNERQFDPAKFASAQPQLVSMNLNSVGSIKLRLIVSWLPLLSSKPSPIHQIAMPNGNGTAAILHQGSEQIGARIPMAKLKQHHFQLPLQSVATAGLSPKIPPKRNQSLGSDISASPPPENGLQMTENGGAAGSPVKICLRDKKRQREQRIQMGISVAAGIGREANRTDKDRWRCSSTTLLDELYKDLSKSIPTIDDLSALHPNKSGSIGGVGGGSLGPSTKSQQQHRAFKSTDDDGLPASDLPPCSSSSVSEGRSKGSAKRIFSFVKRGAEKGGLTVGEERRKKEEWRKSISLGQIALNKEKRSEEKEELGQMEEPEEFHEKNADLQKKTVQNEKNGRNDIGSGGGSARRAKLSNLKKGRSIIEGNTTTSMELNGGTSPSPPSSVTDFAVNKSKEMKSALKTMDALLAKIDALRELLAKLRPAEYTELVGFEAAMLNWEACLKLNRSGILCQLDGFYAANNSNSNGQIQNGGRNRGSAGQQMMRQRSANNRSSTLFLHQQQQHSPSTASDETDESSGGGHRVGGGHPHQNDQISENDSGIDSLRQYHSPYNSSKRQNSIGSNGINSMSKDRRKSIGTMLDVLQAQNSHHQPISATGTVQMDKCLGMHLERAQLALQAIFDVQESPFEYTLTKMLCRMEGVETIALESMLGLVQDLMAQCESNPQNVLLQLGLQFQLQQCWLSACQHLDSFLLAPLAQLRAQLQPICEPIVRARYPKLVEKVLDSLCSLLCDGNICCDDQEISLFQFVALFRGKQFPAFIENLSHEAWITANLLTGQPGPIREVMDRLRNVPVVPPMDSLRHIGLTMVKPGATYATIAPIEKYLRKASPELAMDLAACFLCLLEHKEETGRCGACRALAILGQQNSLQCLEFLSRSDSSVKVRAEAKNATVQIQKILRAIQQQEMTKI